MSVLTEQQILDRIKKGDIVVEPAIDSYQLQAHAIDLRLGYTFLIPKRWHLTDAGREGINPDYISNDAKHNFDVVELEKGQYFDLLPGEYVLASTLESITWPDDLMSVLYPRSSTNRRGLSIDLTGIIDSGYSGQLLIPVRNNTGSQTIRLYPGERFCQVTFEELSESCPKPEGRYHRKDVIEGYIKIHQNENRAKRDEQEIEHIKNGTILELKEEFKIEL